MSVALERRLSKDKVLELYLNDVWLGQRGSFAVHGVPEASRLFFGKDIANVIAGRGGDDRRRHPVAAPPLPVQQPGDDRRNGATSSSRRWPTPGSSPRTPRPAPPASRCRSRRARSRTRRRTSSTTSARSCRTNTRSPARWTSTPRSTCTCRRSRRMPSAKGCDKVDEILAKRKRQRAQAALVAIDPRTGEILALVGGRSYNQIAVQSRAERQPPARVGVQAVRLPGRVRTRLPGVRTDITAATVVLDEPTTWEFNAADVDTGQLRRPVRRSDHAAAGAGAVAQHRHHQGRRDGRLRPGRRTVATGRRRHTAAALSVDRARRVRGDAAAGGGGLHRCSPTAATSAR